MNFRISCFLFAVLFATVAEARYYDAMEGRFISKDPIANGGNIYTLGASVPSHLYVDAVTNPFVYTENNPTNWIDPYGLWTAQLGAGGFGNIGPVVGGADSGVAVGDDNVCFYTNTCTGGGWNTLLDGTLGLVGQTSLDGDLCSGEVEQHGGYWFGGAGIGGEGQVTSDGNGVQYGRGIVGVSSGGAGGGYIYCKTQYYCIK